MPPLTAQISRDDVVIGQRRPLCRPGIDLRAVNSEDRYGSRITRRMVALFVACALLPVAATLLLSYDRRHRRATRSAHRSTARRGRDLCRVADRPPGRSRSAGGLCCCRFGERAAPRAEGNSRPTSGLRRYSSRPVRCPVRRSGADSAAGRIGCGRTPARRRCNSAGRAGRRCAAAGVWIVTVVEALPSGPRTSGTGAGSRLPVGCGRGSALPDRVLRARARAHAACVRKPAARAGARRDSRAPRQHLAGRPRLGRGRRAPPERFPRGLPARPIRRRALDQSSRASPRARARAGTGGRQAGACRCCCSRCSARRWSA